MLKIKPFFKWNDLWIGAYVEIDIDFITAYICPLPTIGLRFRWSRKRISCDMCSKVVGMDAVFRGPIGGYWHKKFLCRQCYEVAVEEEQALYEYRRIR